MLFDDFDTLSSRSQRRLNRKIDSLLADDSKWQPTDWKAKHRRQRWLGIFIGIVACVAAIVGFKFFG